MSEKLNLREKLHIGEKRTGGEKPRIAIFYKIIRIRA